MGIQADNLNGLPIKEHLREANDKNDSDKNRRDTR